MAGGDEHGPDAVAGIREAEEAINSMVDGTHVRMEVEDTGLVVYEFPEIISRFENK